MPIRMKVYHQGKETLVAAADADLVGKTFREGKFKIEVGIRQRRHTRLACFLSIRAY